MMGACVRATSYMVVLLSFISIWSGGADQQAVGVHRCSSKERRALLEFKKGLTHDPYNRLSSWSTDDCCQWAGVHCHNITGAVTLLDLHNPHSGTVTVLDHHNPDLLEGFVFPMGEYTLGGNISPSLLQLESLTYLDLSGNDFQGTPIPSFFGSITNLRHLDLNFAWFGGLVPSQLQNLSSIRYLDLGLNAGLRVDSLGWIAHLRSLEYLDMSWADLQGVEVNWLSVVSMLPSLAELHFSGCQLNPPSLEQFNFSSLQVLDLSHNIFSSRMSDWLFNLSSSIRKLDLLSTSLYGEIPEMITTLRMLEYLDLSYNFLTGLIHPGIGQLKHLETLDLGYNKKLGGSIPWSIGNLTSLRFLDLSFNQLNGAIPESISFLSNLESLTISSNPKLRGIVSEAHLSTLPKLKVLLLSSTSLSLSVGRSWTPPFQLEYLDMSLSKIGPEFPSWLRSQASLQILDISMSGISDTIPNWFWELASGIDSINLSGNQIHGDLTHAWFNSTSIDISSNYFTRQLPHLSPNVRVLSIRNNSVSGPISTFICEESNRNNKLEYLDISMNNLSGEVSECWPHWQSLVHLYLGSNNLSGKIPATIGSLYNLKALQLSQNGLFGEIPLSLNNCTSLGFIDLGENQLSGPIPYWIGERNTALAILRLRSNKFTGNIPLQFCQLYSIRVLDLGNNILSGTILRCLSNFYAMVTDYYRFEHLGYADDYISFLEHLELVTKGTELIYDSNLELVRLIDFSNNMLSGTIPTDISKLTRLRFLNLSHNNLVGEMPKEVGNMTNLESLDLSRNQLSGEIPESISKLSFLNHLDLSYNNLTGSIPSGTQLQSFSESSFLGNVGLCGAPLSKHCIDDTPQGSKPPVEEEAKESDDDMFWFYVGAGPGFAGAFCGVCSTLYFKPAWRQALFWFLEDIMNNVYVFAYVMVNRIKRRLKRSNTGAG